MTARPARSLKSGLVLRLVALQTALLALLLIAATAWTAWYGTIGERSAYHIVDVVRDALARGPDGALILRPTPRLLELRHDIPTLWFVVRDGQGRTLSEGEPPDPTSSGGDRMNETAGRFAPHSTTVDSTAGRVSILTATQRTGTHGDLVLTSLRYYGGLGLYLLLLMVSATVVATPLVVRRALTGLTEAVAQAGRVDFDRRGARIEPRNIPAEIAPLIAAFNDALRRLDLGYERSKRFLVDAAHELRTPIAILQTRLEGQPDSAQKTQLLEDVGRLATLADQLLDLQRLDLEPDAMAPVDLVEIGRRVTADLAPMAIAGGYEISFLADAPHVFVHGEPASLERALINLVQNAIAHGGRRGAIVVAVEAAGSLMVSDEGPGVQADQRERIFEPFHRLDARHRGVGLGLNIVREIVLRHKGRIEVSGNVPAGACFRMSFPTV